MSASLFKAHGSVNFNISSTWQYTASIKKDDPDKCGALKKWSKVSHGFEI